MCCDYIDCFAPSGRTRNGRCRIWVCVHKAFPRRSAIVHRRELWRKLARCAFFRTRFNIFRTRFVPLRSEQRVGGPASASAGRQPFIADVAVISAAISVFVRGAAELRHHHQNHILHAVAHVQPEGAEALAVLPEEIGELTVA